MSQLRVGVAGTGVWARTTHLSAAAASPDVVLTAVYGRSRPDDLAAAYGVEAHDDLDAFLADVDIAVLSLPPEAQPAIATRAARAGVHLVLEKPLARDPESARAVEEAVVSSGVAAAVFFTHLFHEGRATWLDAQAAAGGWMAASAEAYGGLLIDPDDPFASTSWRRAGGGLWDLGPHSVAQLLRVLGPIARVEASAGPGDLMVATLTHAGGAVSTMRTALDRPGVPGGFSLRGPRGVAVAPPMGDWGQVARGPARTALAAVVRGARTGAPVLPGVTIGREVVSVLAAIEESARVAAPVSLRAAR